MQELLNFGKKIINTKKFTSGVAAIIEMTDSMWVVVVADNKNWIIASKNFTFTKGCKTKVQKNCKTYYNYCKDCLAKKQLQLLEEYEN